jgi:spermidine synthase
MARRRAASPVIAVEGELTVLRDADRPSGRLLRQGDMDASYVDLADAAHLEFDYLRWMAAVVEASGARDVVHVGGAGCALARALAAGSRDRRQEVVEVDPAVVELARRHLGLRRAPGLRVRVGDGRAAIGRRPASSADAVLVDAFVGARVPRHLVTLEALADVARVLRPDGIVAVNVVDARGLPDARAIAAALGRCLRTVTMLGHSAVVHGRRGGNTVVVASRADLPLTRIRSQAAADPSPAVVLAPEDVRQMTDGVQPWLDGGAGGYAVAYDE